MEKAYLFRYIKNYFDSNHINTMNSEEKCEMLINKGYTYNPNNSLIYNRYGKIVNTKDDYGYKVIGGYVKQHQFIFYCEKGYVPKLIDHDDMNKLNNNINNLIDSTNQENLWNTKAKGIYYYKRSKKWGAKICVNNKQIFLGYHDCPLMARISYLNAKDIYHKKTT